MYRIWDKALWPLLGHSSEYLSFRTGLKTPPDPWSARVVWMSKCICCVHADERRYEKTWQRRTRHRVNKRGSSTWKRNEKNGKIWTWDRYGKIWHRVPCCEIFRSSVAFEEKPDFEECHGNRMRSNANRSTLAVRRGSLCSVISLCGRQWSKTRSRCEISETSVEFKDFKR